MPLVSQDEDYMSEKYFGVFGHETYPFSCARVVRVELKGPKPNFGQISGGGAKMNILSCLSLTEAFPAQLMLMSVW